MTDQLPSHPKSRSRFFSKIKSKINSSSASREDRSVSSLSSPPIDLRSDSAEPSRSTGRPAPVSLQNSTDSIVGHSNDVATGVVGEISTSTIQAPILRPISELWDEAYDDLRKQDEALIKDYERAIAKITATNLDFLDKGVPRNTQMRHVLDYKISEVQKSTWKLRFHGHEKDVKELVEPVVGVIDWANDYIESAVAANPYASIAWAGVSLLLPLVLNPSKQAVALADGLEYISKLVVQSSMREALYTRRYDADDSRHEKTFISCHDGYKDSLQELYVQILCFQATSFCFYSSNGAFRVGLDMIKWNDWEALLNKIKTQENHFAGIYEVWKDMNSEEESLMLERRHKESLKCWQSIDGNVSGLRRAVEIAQRDGQRADLLSWLSSVDPSQNYNAARDQHKATTGDWLVQDDSRFNEWKTNPNSFLWLHGKAGSGKSVLRCESHHYMVIRLDADVQYSHSSSVIKHLKDSYDEDPRIALAYFYFSFNDSQKQDTGKMLRSLIKQLCCCRPDSPQPLLDLAKYKELGQNPETERLKDTLLACMHGFKEVYIVIDALDECPDGQGERERLINSLTGVISTTNSSSLNLHFLCTSRKEKDIGDGFEHILRQDSAIVFDLSVYVEAVDRDIGLYIDETLTSPAYKSWPSKIKEEARTALVEKADGMFQYVSCQFKELKRLQQASEIREALKDLPKGLDATYERMLLQIDPRIQKKVSNILKFLTVSLKPLTLSELAEAFIIDCDKPVPFDKNERLFKPESVLDYLSGLVTMYSAKARRYIDRYGQHVQEYVKEIRFAHFSVKEYLISQRIRDSPAAPFSVIESQAHMHIAESCLTYHLELSKIESATKATVRENALWDYAIRHGVHHLDQSSEELSNRLVDRALQSFKSCTKALLNALRIVDVEREAPVTHLKLRPDDICEPLYCAVAYNAFRLTTLLLDNHANINEDNNSYLYSNALQVAADHKNESIVRVLVEKGADVNMQGGAFGNALQAAAFRGSENVAKLLLDHGANVNANGGFLGHALQAAAVSKSDSIVKLLLDHGANVNANGGIYGYALQAATYHDNEKTVLLLLQEGADINMNGGSYGSALQAAALFSTSMVELMLKNGAEVNITGGIYGNALQAAIAEGNNKTARLLLSHGARLEDSESDWEATLLRIQDDHQPKILVDRLRRYRVDPVGFLDAVEEEC